MTFPSTGPSPDWKKTDAQADSSGTSSSARELDAGYESHVGSQPQTTSGRFDTSADAAFASMLGRPVVITAGGPSGVLPDPQLIPADAVVLRTGAFYLESQYDFGSHVDAWVWDGNRGALDGFIDELRAGRYTCPRILSTDPVLPADGQHRVNSLSGTGAVQLDLWDPVFRHRRLARLLAIQSSRPRVEFVAIAAAAALGFTDIRLFGFDQIDVAGRNRRIGSSITSQAATRLTGRTNAGTYTSNEIDVNLAFLRATLEEFPAADITCATHVPLLASVLERSDAAQHPAALPRQGLLKAHMTLSNGSLAEVSPANPEPYAEIAGKRCAYVTLVGGNYHHGARALARSMAQVTTIPLIVLCAPGADRQALERSGLNCIDVPEIMTPHQPGEMQERFAATYTKLNVFRLGFLDRVVYIDSDALMINNIDELFTREGFWAVSDAGIHLENEGFNSGVFACEPSVELFDQLVSQVGKLPSADGGDQGFLNSFFGDDWNRLPLEYNTTKRIWRSHNPLFNLNEVKVLHYVGVKPWSIDPGHDDYGDVIDLWFDYLADFELRELLREWSRFRGKHAPIAQKLARPVKKIRDAEQAYAAGDIAAAKDIATRILAWDPTSVRSAKLLTEISLRENRYRQAAVYAASAAKSFLRKRLER